MRRMRTLSVIAVAMLFAVAEPNSGIGGPAMRFEFGAHVERGRLRSDGSATTSLVYPLAIMRARVPAVRRTLSLGRSTSAKLCRSHAARALHSSVERADLNNLNLRSTR